MSPLETHASLIAGTPAPAIAPPTDDELDRAAHQLAQRLLRVSYLLDLRTLLQTHRHPWGTFLSWKKAPASQLRSLYKASGLDDLSVPVHWRPVWNQKR